MIDRIRLTQERRKAWLRDGDGSVPRRLAQIGVLGWIVISPILLGIFAGRWLDSTFHTGLQWTAALLMLGAGLGMWSAWKWMQRA